MLLIERIPAWPLAGPTHKIAMSQRLPAARALHQKYLQPNPQGRLGLLVFDIDIYKNGKKRREDPMVHVMAGRAPVPNALIWNQASGNCHALVLLADPVGLTGGSRQAPIRFAEAIQSALRLAYGGDGTYTHDLMRGPYARGHALEVLRVEPYELRDLANAVGLAKKNWFRGRRPVEEGRNVALFEELRRYAYQIIGESSSLDFKAALERQAVGINLGFIGKHPQGALPESEVKEIVESISRWCWKNRATLKPRIAGARYRDRQHSDAREEKLPEEERHAVQSAAAAYTNKTRKAETTSGIRAAIDQLLLEGKPVTRGAVATLSGRHEKTVQKHPEWKAWQSTIATAEPEGGERTLLVSGIQGVSAP